MTPQELKAKIVEMLACDEIHELRKREEPRMASKEQIKDWILKYEEVIAFIFNQLERTND